jgi:hypothetical protein
MPVPNKTIKYTPQDKKYSKATTPINIIGVVANNHTQYDA